MRNLHPQTSPRRQLGLSLVELMVSMVIGLLILAALTFVYLGSRATYRSNDAVARIQESGRLALDLMVEDLRMAGFAGCRTRSLSVADGTLFNATNPPVNYASSADTLRVFDEGAGWANPSAITRERGDVIRMLRVFGAASAVTGNDMPARTITMQSNLTGIRNGDIVMVSSCDNAMLFRVTNNPATGALQTTLEFKTAGAPGGTGNVAAITADPFLPYKRPEVFRFNEVQYFIGRNPAGRPALYRWANGVTEELADNIEDLDVVLTVTDGSAPKEFKRPADIALADWDKVSAVRITLVAVSDERVAGNPQTYALRDSNGDGKPETQTAADTRLRQVFTTTVALRNRAL